MAHGIKIIKGDREGQWRVLRDDTMLCGLITIYNREGPRKGW